MSDNAKEPTIEDRVMLIIAETTGVDIEQLNGNTELFNDLGLDSLDRFELILNMEDEFGIEIDDEITYKMDDIDDVGYYIEKMHKIQSRPN